MAKTFVHEEAYRGADLLAKLAKKTVVICGAGALGSNLADTLARQGFTKLRVIDMDRVESHNVNTQVYGNADVGAMKVAALRNRLFRDVGVQLQIEDKELKAGNAKKLLKGADLVIDAFDNSESRRLVRETCRAEGIDCLHAGMYEDYGEVVWDESYSVPDNQTAGDVCDYPLARNIVSLVVSIAAEEAVYFCTQDTPRRKSWSVTMRDFAIRAYR